MVKLTIDGREVEAEEGTTILDAARDNNIYIPSLCAHESVEPYGACRLCLVEVVARGRERLVASCLYPVAEGLLVKTNSDRVMASRKLVLELLLARCPDSEVLQDLALQLGIDGTPFSLEDHQKCVLCALCTRACEEVVGVSAISLVNRGVNRQIATPFYEHSDACIACWLITVIRSRSRADNPSDRAVIWAYRTMVAITLLKSWAMPAASCPMAASRSCC